MKIKKIYKIPHVKVEEVQATCGLMLAISGNGTTDESLTRENIDWEDDDWDDTWGED